MRGYVLPERGGKRRLENPRAHLLAAGGKRAHVAAIERAQTLFDALAEAIGSEEFAERFGGGGEAARHADPGRSQAADHLAERGVLAADPLQVGHAEIF